MKRIKLLMMLLAMMAGGSLAYGQTGPQDTYYKFDQTYAAGANVAPYVGNGGELTLSKAVKAVSEIAASEMRYMSETYSFAAELGVQAYPLSIPVLGASVDNPAHIYIIAQNPRYDDAAPSLRWNLEDENDANNKLYWVNTQNTKQATEMVEFVTTTPANYKLYYSISNHTTYSSDLPRVAEIRIIYEQNATWQSIKHSRELVLNASKTLASNPADCMFMRLTGAVTFTNAGRLVCTGNESYSNHTRTGVMFTPYADGTIEITLDNTASPQEFTLTIKEYNETNHQFDIITQTFSNPVGFVSYDQLKKGTIYLITIDDNKFSRARITNLRFIPDYYTVTLDANGGTVNPTKLVYIKDGDPIMGFPEPSNGNYMFDGWDPAAPSFPYAPTADITYTAQWTNPHGQCGDNLFWEYNPSTYTLTITGTGAMYDYNTTSNRAPWYAYRHSITTIVLPDGLTSIGKSAFYQCDNAALTSITLSDELTLINSSAFMGCTGLTSITIPGNVETIQNSAFYGCSNLADVYIYRATAPFVSPATFNSIASPATLHVPYGASGYTGSSWNTFTNIVEMNPSGQCGDNLFWEYNPSTYTLTITGTGEMSDFATTDAAPWYAYRADITSVSLPDGLTHIGKNAFYQCNNASLTTIPIPSTVTSIGDYAFWYCSGLTSITLPEGLTSIGTGAFRSCNNASLTTINIPSSMTSLPSAMFENCTSLTSVTIPNTVTDIGGSAFRNCSSLLTITLPEGLTTIYVETFSGCSSLTSIKLPSGLTTIHGLAFSGCSSLASIDIPASVTTMNDWNIFQGCSILLDVYVHWPDPSSVNASGDAFFTVFSTPDRTMNLHVPYGKAANYSATDPWNKSYFNIVEMNPQGKCGDNLYWEYDINGTHALTITGTGDMWDYTTSAPAPWHEYRTSISDIFLPNELTGIGANAFASCINVTSVTIPNSVTSIGDRAFEGCRSLTSVTLPEGLTSTGNNAFDGCSGLTSVILPSSLQSIGNTAFRNCKILTSIDIPSNVTSIGQYAFNGCKALESVTIPEGVTAINSATFLGCIGLTSINLPSHLTSIGSSAFKNCSTLTSITLPISVTAISSHSFDHCTGLTDMYVSWDTHITGVGSLAFDGVTLANIRLHVPCGTKNAYAAASPWSSFTIVDPCEGHYPITAKADPNDANTYYSTFYYGTAKYLVPEDVEAYAASVNGSDLVLTKIADAGDVLPAETAVILKSTIGSYTMVPSTDAAITNTAGNQLLGVDEATPVATAVTSGTCYVLSGHSSDNSIVEVGFYTFSGTLGKHKAYLVMPSSNPAPPRHLRFVFDSAMDIEQPTSDSSLKGGEKILLDGVLYIERGEHLYNAQGVRVK